MQSRTAELIWDPGPSERAGREPGEEVCTDPHKQAARSSFGACSCSSIQLIAGSFLTCWESGSQTPWCWGCALWGLGTIFFPPLCKIFAACREENAAAGSSQLWWQSVSRYIKPLEGEVLLFYREAADSSCPSEGHNFFPLNFAWILTQPQAMVYVEWGKMRIEDNRATTR